MLRTTISRIRKVCSVSFIPRILRGDQCSAAVSSAVIRKAHKSTKSTEDGEQDTTKKNNDYTFSSAAELRIDDKFKRKIGEANENKQPILTTKLPLTHRERCQRIIDQAFGKAERTQPDRVLSEQYFSHTVNLEDTRCKIHESEKEKMKLQEQKINIEKPLLPDDRSQYSIYKMSSELNEKDDNHNEIIITDSASAREPDLTKNLENVKGTAEETPPVEEPSLPQAKEDFDKCVNNPESIEKKALCNDDAETIEVVKDERKPDFYQKATPTYQPHVPWFLNATTARERNLTYAKQNVDECVNNPESVEKKALCDDDSETIKLVKDERKHDLYQIDTPNDQPHTPPVLNATTEKQDEELLTQKLETIEETPIVEAHKPKLEGFNVTPRILGNEPTLNCKITEKNQDNSPKVDLPCALDEVSKRCLNCPLGQIDELLINEMEKLGMTCRTAHKAPSTPMEDDLVQMDVLTKQPKGTIEEQEIYSESPELEEKENESATDTRIPDVSDQVEPLRKSEETVKQAKEEPNDIIYTDHIRIELKPLSCKSEEFNPTDDYNNTTKFASYYLPPTHRAVELNKKKIEDTLPNSRAHIDKQIEEPVSLDGPLLKGPLSETPNSHVLINNQTAEPYSIQSIEGNVLNETAKNARPAAAEAENTSAEDINKNVTSFNSLNDASDNIRHEKLLKPEYSSNFKGVNIPLYNSKINASKSAGNEDRTPAEIELERNSFYSSNLNAAYVWGNHQNGSASNYRNVQQTFPKETDEVEHHGQTRPSTTEVQGELEERQTTANRLYVKVPYTNFSLPGEKWNKEMEHLPIADKISQQCSTEKSQPLPEQNSEKASLPEEILKEHKLDPYYVLTCNETCPISPGSTMSTCQNNDFVDTTETLYMKKNICESVRPKPQPIIKCENMSSGTQAHPNDMELKPETMPEIKATGMPEFKCTSIPDAIERSMPKLGEQVALSELLRRVREKRRLAYNETKSGLDVQAVGKCGSKAPRCVPTAPRSPPNNPVPPPTFGLPMLKRRPPVCKPKRKPSNKCSCATNDGDFFPEMHLVLNEAEVCAVRSKENLTEEVIESLHNLGKILGGVLRQVKSNVETLLARDYEPWTPIPSWKIPQKVEKKEWRPGMHGLPPCVDGCPVFPKARTSMNPEPPCNLKPCEGFPKRRSFSMLDCFTVSLGENKVYDLGDF